jgi:hypothetical protein
MDRGDATEAEMNQHGWHVGKIGMSAIFNKYLNVEKESAWTC